jgi:hypothetical protein
LSNQPLPLCGHCQTAFRPRSGRPQKYCSVGCARAARRVEAPPAPEPAIAAAIRRGHVGSKGRRLARAQLGWTAWLCHEAIPRSLQYPHPDSFSQDHAEPWSQGGSDDLDDLRPAHLVCNIVHGDRPIEQFPALLPRVARLRARYGVDTGLELTEAIANAESPGSTRRRYL